MKIIKALALVAFAAASLGLSACASKTTVVEPTPASYGYSK